MTGIVTAVHDNPPTAYTAKPVHQVLDSDPLVTPLQLAHWEWMARYYMANLGEVLRAALPAYFLLESETRVTRGTGRPSEELEEGDRYLWEALPDSDSLTVGQLADRFGHRGLLKRLERLEGLGLLARSEGLKDRYRPRLKDHVALPEGQEVEAAVQANLEALVARPANGRFYLQYFALEAAHAGLVPVDRLLKGAGAARGQLNPLLDKGMLELRRVPIDRWRAQTGARSAGVVLSPAQERAHAGLTEVLEGGRPCLLHGVTASGKTEVYLKLMERELSEGRQALFLLPEIALTTQLTARLFAHFGDRVGVFHSRLSPQERVELWNHVRYGEAKCQIMIGARSSLFLPFRELGLIVVDEEHDASYKQRDPAPRYHARDAALMLGRLHASKVVLGSATPSVESYHNASTGKYGKVELSERFGGYRPPEVEVVDLARARTRHRLKGHFAQDTWDALETVLSEGRQAIIFQNRRGYAPIMECETCGHAPGCPNCDVSLTLHLAAGQLRCHYCGHSVPVPKVCSECGHPTLSHKGLGTEQVEEAVASHFPEAKTARMDMDTTRGKHALPKLLESFGSGDIDILVGTQMVTKGLDFRNVGLVVVTLADNLLNFPDYRAHERAFQLLVQVAGRAGRGPGGGRVIVQTFRPGHPVVGQAVTGDYTAMYRAQLEERRQFGYPPFNASSVIGLRTVTCSSSTKRLNGWPWHCASDIPTKC